MKFILLSIFFTINLLASLSFKNVSTNQPVSLTNGAATANIYMELYDFDDVHHELRLNWQDGSPIETIDLSSLPSNIKRVTVTPTHTYNTADTYNVIATFINENNLNKSEIIQIDVIDNSETSGTLSIKNLVSNGPVEVGANLNVSFDIVDTNNQHNQVIIDWGDGSSETDSSLGTPSSNSISKTYTHVFPSSGSYDIKITFKDINNNEVERTLTVGVIEPDVTHENNTEINILNSVNVFEIDENIALNLKLYDLLNKHSSIEIDWGDGSPISTQNIKYDVPDINHFLYKTYNHSYSNSGNFEIVVSFYNEDGDLDFDTFDLTVTEELNNIAITNSSITNDITTGDFADISLDLYQKINQSINTIEINWGDSPSNEIINVSSTQNNFSKSYSHQYNVAGSYNISVEIKDNTGLSDSTSFTLNVIDPVNTPSITDNKDNESVFTNNELGFSINISNTLNNYFDTLNIDWGDGSINYQEDMSSSLGKETTKTISHTYTSAGTYTVTYTYTDKDSNVAIDTTTITVTDEVNEIDIRNIVSNSPVQLNQQLDFMFEAYSKFPGELKKVDIDWGDGSTIETEELNTSTQSSNSILKNHTYTAAGTYTISITLEDKDGNIESETYNIEMKASLNEISIEDLQVNGNTFTNENTNFTLNLISLIPDQHNLLTIDWGDGNTQDINVSTTVGSTKTISVDHNYSTSGPKTAIFTFTDKNTLSTSDSLTFEITDEPNVAINNISITSPSYLNENLTLTGTLFSKQQGEHKELIINWGDGTSSETLDLSSYNENNINLSQLHTYTTLGNKSISLSLELNDGTIINETLNINIEVKPNILDLSGFNSTYSIKKGETLDFTIRAISSEQGSHENVTIDWGDGTSNFTVDLSTYNLFEIPFAASHKFDTPNEHNVSISFLDKNGTTYSENFIVNVADNISEIKNISTEKPFINAPTSLSFNVESTLESHNNQITINWGDGITENIDISSETSDYLFFSLEHNYSTANNYDINITVTDINNNTFQNSTIVNINDVQVAISSVLSNSPIYTGNVATLSYTLETSLENSLSSLDVDWGDGNTENVNLESILSDNFSDQMVHVYDTNGTYNVNIIVTDKDGNTDNKTLDIDVLNITNPNENMNISLSSITADKIHLSDTLEVEFTFSEPNQNHDYALITWGDSSSPENIDLANPVPTTTDIIKSKGKVYNETGTHTLKVEFFNTSGQKETFLKSIKVYEDNETIPTTPNSSTISINNMVYTYNNDNKELSLNFDTFDSNAEHYEVIVNWDISNSSDTQRITSFSINPDNNNSTHNLTHNYSGETGTKTVEVTFNNNLGDSTKDFFSFELNEDISEDVTNGSLSIKDFTTNDPIFLNSSSSLELSAVLEDTAKNHKSYSIDWGDSIIDEKDIEDNTSSFENKPLEKSIYHTHNYAAAGDYNLVLTFFDTLGNSVSLNKTVSILEEPLPVEGNPGGGTPVVDPEQSDYIFNVESPTMVDIYFKIFNAMASLFSNEQTSSGSMENGNTTYVSMIRLIFVLGGFFVFAAGTIRAASGDNPQAVLVDFTKYMLVGVAILTLFFNENKSTIYIKSDILTSYCETTDTDNYNPTHNEIMVDNVPHIIAWTFSSINNLGHETTKLARMAFSSETDDAQQRTYGFATYLEGIGTLTQMNLTDFTEDDPAKRTTLTSGFNHFIQGCFIETAAIATQEKAKYLGSIFDNTGAPFKTIDDAMNQNKLVSYRNPSSTGGTTLLSDLTVNEIQLGYFFFEMNGENFQCQSYWNTELKPAIEEIKNGTLECQYLLKETLNPQMVKVLTGDGTNVSLSKAKEIAINTGIMNSVANAQNKVGVATEFNYAEGKTRADFVTNSMGTGYFMAKMLPYLQMAMRAILYAFFPFVFLVFLLPGGMKIIINYLQSLIWIELWMPTAAILDMFVSINATKKFSDMYNTTGYNLSNATPIFSDAAMLGSVGGYLYASVPALTWLILKGSGHMLGNISGSMAGTLQKNLNSDQINKDAESMKATKEFNRKTGSNKGLGTIEKLEAENRGATRAGVLAGQEEMKKEGHNLTDLAAAKEKEQLINAAAAQKVQAANSTQDMVDARADAALAKQGVDSATRDRTDIQLKELIANGEGVFTPSEMKQFKDWRKGIQNKDGKSLQEATAKLSQIGVAGGARSRLVSDANAKAATELGHTAKDQGTLEASRSDAMNKQLIRQAKTHNKMNKDNKQYTDKELIQQSLDRNAAIAGDSKALQNMSEEEKNEYLKTQSISTLEAYGRKLGMDPIATGTVLNAMGDEAYEVASVVNKGASLGVEAAKGVAVTLAANKFIKARREQLKSASPKARKEFEEKVLTTKQSERAESLAQMERKAKSNARKNNESEDVINSLTKKEGESAGEYIKRMGKRIDEEDLSKHNGIEADIRTASTNIKNIKDEIRGASIK